MSRSEAQLRADATYRARNPQTLLRHTPEELEVLDVARGDLSRAAYISLVLRRALGLRPADYGDAPEAEE